MSVLAHVRPSRAWHRVARHRGAVGFVGGLVSAGLLGSGVALAAIPSTATGTITACVHRSTGATRIVDFQAGRHCTTSELTIGWSKGMRYRGPWSAGASYATLDVVSFAGGSYLARVPSTAKAPTLLPYWGPLSVRGADGPRGTAGERGLDGLRGADGAQGQAGAQGLQGLQGAQGAQGLQGHQGLQGPQGLTGATGVAGAPGKDGATGPQGPAGVLGRTVVTLSADLPPGSFTLLAPQCAAGSVPIAGGAHVGTNFPGWGNASVAYVAESDLDNAGTGWASTLVTTSAANPTTHFVAHVICVSAA